MITATKKIISNRFTYLNTLLYQQSVYRFSVRVLITYRVELYKLRRKGLKRQNLRLNKPGLWLPTHQEMYYPYI